MSGLTPQTKYPDLVHTHKVSGRTLRTRGKHKNLTLMIDQSNDMVILYLYTLIYWISDLGTSMVITTYLPITVEPHVLHAVL